MELICTFERRTQNTLLSLTARMSKSADLSIYFSMFEIDSTILIVFSHIGYPLLNRLRRNKEFEVGLSIFETIPLPFLPYDLSYFYEELR